jgi:hypothetical protein
MIGAHCRPYLLCELEAMSLELLALSMVLKILCKTSFEA